MRKLDLIRAEDELYEVIERFSVYKFSTEITGGKAEDLKQWFGVEKILRDTQRNEYLFVNKIEEAEMVE